MIMPDNLKNFILISNNQYFGFEEISKLLQVPTVKLKEEYLRSCDEFSDKIKKSRNEILFNRSSVFLFAMFLPDYQNCKMLNEYLLNVNILMNQ